MNDKELLELAAKAAGIEVIADAEERGLWIKHKFLAWNPLTDDGDALRLAVKLNLFDGLEKAASNLAAEFNFDIDPCEATRRAIVRTAADIGRGME